LVYWDQILDFIPMKHLIQEPAELVS
jgi:hypothetical protein